VNSAARTRGKGGWGWLNGVMGRDPDVLTLTQAATLVGVSDDRLKAEVDAGRLAARRIGRTWRFTRPALMAWLEGRGDGDDRG
jgi:excisionase family DNA binding protein